ncbi:hypothetical protein LDO26_05990 [Luteimonas sp. BDR2-5]|uniref:hypothetical protein n=1 Tax=Proluteimonas luteida TaxID=2878685 RepID=UPI001E5B52DE|nr:hypothetical protein [Luteimonas sp. BDR2-5]MCD9027752.1 hypothetical protein [Luteimonas sp. BDR2-5]
MHAGRPRIAAALACALAAGAGPASADCLDWAQADIRDGVVEDLPGSGETTWRLGIAPTGFGHQREALAVRWRDADGQARRQLLFDGIGSVEYAQLELEPDADGLVVRRLDCGFRDTCRRRSMRFAYDVATRRFEGSNHWGTFAFDPDDGRWRPAPPMADSPVPAADCPAGDAFAPPR